MVILQKHLYIQVIFQNKQTMSSATTNNTADRTVYLRLSMLKEDVQNQIIYDMGFDSYLQYSNFMFANGNLDCFPVVIRKDYGIVECHLNKNASERLLKDKTMTFEPFSFQMCDIKQEYAYFILDKIVPVSGTFAEYDRLMRQYLIYYGDKDYITIHLPFPADPEPVSVKKEPVCETPTTPPVVEVETPKAPAKPTRQRSTRNRVQPKRLFADETEKKEEDVPVEEENPPQKTCSRWRYCFNPTGRSFILKAPISYGKCKPTHSSKRIWFENVQDTYDTVINIGDTDNDNIWFSEKYEGWIVPAYHRKAMMKEFNPVFTN